MSGEDKLELTVKVAQSRMVTVRVSTKFEEEAHLRMELRLCANIRTDLTMEAKV